VRQYGVYKCQDDTDILQNAVAQLGQKGARIVSVTWQSERMVQTNYGPQTLRPSFTIVYEYGGDDAPGP
jgi:hypothetical protein